MTTRAQAPARSGDGVLEAIDARFARSPWVLLLDVDGTLAPLASRPDEARVPERTRAVLRRCLAHSDVHAALVTGRAAADALRLVDIPGLWVVGNHGIETVGPSGELLVDAEAASFAEPMQEAARELVSLFGDVPGVAVEDKRWTLSVHYRLADRSVFPRLQAAVDAVAASRGLRVTQGKLVVELRPPVTVHKGTTSVALARRLVGDTLGAAILCAGDDRTDEDMFEAVRAAAPWAATVRVHAEDDGSVETAAEFLVEGTEGMRRVLEHLADRLERRQT